jgi:hypothetical protein
LGLNLISSTYATSQVPYKAVAEKKEEGNLLFRIAKQFGKHLDIACFSNKVASTVLDWMKLLPLSDGLLSLIANRRHMIKSVTSLFNLPKFFVKQIRRYEVCSELKERLTSNIQRLHQWVDNVKKIFFTALSTIIAGLKLPRLLDKAGIIDLSKISRMLSTRLARGACLCSLVLCSMKFVDTAWTLRSHLKKEHASPKWDVWHPSRRLTRTILKLGSNSIKLLAHSLSAAVLFLGWYSNPLVFVTVSTATLGFSFATKTSRDRKSICGSHAKKAREAGALLPA